MSLSPPPRPSSPSESLTEEECQTYLAGLTPSINDLFANNTASDLTVGLTEIGQRFTWVRGADGTLVPITEHQKTPAHEFMLLFCHSEKSGMDIIDYQENPTPSHWLMDLKEASPVGRVKSMFNKLIGGS
ncbi:hypothetical protein HBH92_055030 [Parastagonospora nodorum]|nr:hypothetical protein HBH92_055030 [Parastagonospora nodorum]KAH4449931.1 hypothetical protein HBH93_034040 [Parastagonospora nodorum]KAH4463839.1 hypothetical protein HBH91_051090 [Parastagonospora nodorum]KAH4506807.1 hypothetical protein HBH89_081110 [Parastagonospora nodorum]KAH4551779.1 hypothetical protein HBH85_028970 [Parastagonospora nodorum]